MPQWKQMTTSAPAHITKSQEPFNLKTINVMASKIHSNRQLCEASDALTLTSKRVNNIAGDFTNLPCW